MYTSQGVAKEGRQQRQRQKIKWKGGSGREERKERGAEERKRKVMRKSRQEMALVLCQSLSHQHGHPETPSSQQLAESLNEGGLASSGRTRHPESEGRSQLAQQMSPPTRENLC